MQKLLLIAKIVVLFALAIFLLSAAMYFNKKRETTSPSSLFTNSILIREKTEDIT